MTSATVTKDARPATRIVCGGEKALTFLKRWGNRRARRARHRHEKALALDAEALERKCVRPITGWDVA